MTIVLSDKWYIRLVIFSFSSAVCRRLKKTLFVDKSLHTMKIKTLTFNLTMALKWEWGKRLSSNQFVDIEWIAVIFIFHRSWSSSQLQCINFNNKKRREAIWNSSLAKTKYSNWKWTWINYNNDLELLKNRCLSSGHQWCRNIIFRLAFVRPSDKFKPINIAYFIFALNIEIWNADRFSDSIAYFGSTEIEPNAIPLLNRQKSIDWIISIWPESETIA